MKVLCHGIQKSGTHALVKAVQLLGVPDTVHSHIPFDGQGLDKLPEKRIYIRRNLRNVLVSWVRFYRPKITEGYLICAVKNFVGGKSIHEVKREYDGWLLDQLSVRFEDLLADDSTLRNIASYLGVPYLKSAFDNLPGGTQTYNKVPSCWKEHWTKGIDKVWEESKRKAYGTAY